MKVSKLSEERLKILKDKELLKKEALRLHRENKGKLAVIGKVPAKDELDLSLAYSPGVAEPCLAIRDDPESIYEYTIKGNTVAVVTNGTAVLGLGDIGAAAGAPVMEGKAFLFKTYADIDSFPICIDTKDPEKVIEVTKLIEPIFGGINLEDIKAPECFYIEERLKKEMNIPVFHDDQHGTAIIALAGLINALKIVGKKLNEVKIVTNGAGASGIAIIKHLINAGADPGKIIMCDSKGVIYEGRKEGMNPYKDEIAKITNKEGVTGTLADAMKGADVFLGLSVAGAVTKDMVRSMADDPIVFAMANPVPEIMPEDAKEAGARIVATGRSDYPNQVNNVLGFPGIFRGALDVYASDINEEMKMAASMALAELVSDEELNEEYIIPKPYDPRVVPAVASYVAEAAVKSGVARRKITREEEYEAVEERLRYRTEKHLKYLATWLA